MTLTTDISCVMCKLQFAMRRVANNEAATHSNTTTASIHQKNKVPLSKLIDIIDDHHLSSIDREDSPNIFTNDIMRR